MNIIETVFQIKRWGHLPTILISSYCKIRSIYEKDFISIPDVEHKLLNNLKEMNNSFRIPLYNPYKDKKK